MEWRPVVGWEGLYEVSDAGDVRSLTRVVETEKGPKKFIGRLLKQGRVEGGYFHVALSRPGERKEVNVHVEVARAFLGPCPEGMEVCHRDGSRTLNAVGNLRYGTRKSNAEDRILHGTNTRTPSRIGEEVHTAKLTLAQVLEIRASEGTLASIGAKYGVHLGTVHCIKARKTWRHI